MSGLLAARALSDSFKEITILDRDVLPETISNRRGVPQGWHAHAILAGGSRELENQFPAITQELIDSGAILGDLANDGRWFLEGAALRRAPSSAKAILASRPLLEGTIRDRVRKMSGITIRDGCSVDDLVYSDGRVTGVGLKEGETLNADLVVDASRGGAHRS